MALSYIALIPAYKPGGKMTETAAELREKGFDIIIVDDGSGPDYEDNFRQAEENATVLTHEINRGKGAAIKTGLAYISRYKICGDMKPSDIVIVTVDADGQHLPKDALHIARTAGSRPGTLILGSRALAENVPLRSRFGNSVTRHVFRAVSGIRIHDTQTGLRAFTADMIPALLAVKGDRYEYEINELLCLAADGTPIEEAEIETVYLDGNSSSHFDTIRDSCRIYREIISFALKRGRLKKLFQLMLFSASSFASFLIDYALYAVLLISGQSLVFANVAARLVSAGANYAINRSLVFRSKSRIAGSALQYFALAALILTGNTLVLRTLVGAGMGRMAAKVVTEVVFFLISWTVQRYVIFHSAEETGPSIEEQSGTDVGQAYTLEFKAARPRKLKNVYYKDAKAKETVR